MYQCTGVLSLVFDCNKVCMLSHWFSVWAVMIPYSVWASMQVQSAFDDCQLSLGIMCWTPFARAASTNTQNGPTGVFEGTSMILRTGWLFFSFGFFVFRYRFFFSERDCLLCAICDTWLRAWKPVVRFPVAIQYRLFAHGTERKTGVAKLDPWSNT